MCGLFTFLHINVQLLSYYTEEKRRQSALAFSSVILYTSPSVRTEDDLKENVQDVHKRTGNICNVHLMSFRGTDCHSLFETL